MPDEPNQRKGRIDALIVLSLFSFGSAVAEYSFIQSVHLVVLDLARIKYDLQRSRYLS